LKKREKKVSEKPVSKQTYALTLEPLTGVHIGTGEVLTPLDYKVIDARDKNGAERKIYVRFSTDSVLSRLIAAGGAGLGEFERAIEAGNTAELRCFFHRNCTPDDFVYASDVTKGFVAQYNRNLQKDPLENAAQVFQMYRPAGSKKPVIPGSSLKGAIRTALLNKRLADLPDGEYQRLHDNTNLQDRRADESLQKRLLNYRDPKDDPLRCVAVGDCPFPVKDTQLVGLMKNVSVSKSGDEIFSIEKLQIQAEILRGRLLGGKAKGDFSLTLDLELPNQIVRGERLIQNAVSMEEIVTACNGFYLSAFEDEYKTFYQNALEGAEIAGQLRKALGEVRGQKDRFVLRLGRWSQVESMTYTGDFRRPKTPPRGDRSGSWGGTRTVFDYDGRYAPLGWCLATINIIN
jgi:CRISPR-associated protein Csm5